MGTTNLQLHIDAQALNRLILQGQLKIDDFRCYDKTAKNLIKNMYLEAAKQSLHKTLTDSL
ncbi:hypothetical protein TDB9533_04370 [Thalassocella blandensis]|nr:hypothetical protein TDB9533_04370 [Thalassocella blandensis]